MKIDTRPYVLNPHRDNEHHCVCCDEPIWLPHRDDCRWQVYFPPVAGVCLVPRVRDPVIVGHLKQLAGVLRALVTSRHGATATLALDTLIATTLDSNQDRRLRLAAFDALQDMPAKVRAPIAEALRRDSKNTLREIAALADKETARATAVWTDAIDGRLPENPADLREALNAEAASAPRTPDSVSRR